MKMIVQTKRWRLFPARLYLDDIERMIDLIKSAGYSVALTVGDVSYYNMPKIEGHTQENGGIQEMKEDHGEILRSLEILAGVNTTDGGSLAFRWSCDEDSLLSTLLISDDDLKLRGLASEIREVIERRKKRFAAFAIRNSGAIAIAFAVLFLLGILVSHYIQLRPDPVFLIAGLVTGAVVGAIVTVRAKFLRTVVVLRRRGAPGFWSRISDSLFKYIIGALIGVVGTCISGWIQSHWPAQSPPSMVHVRQSHTSKASGVRASDKPAVPK